MLNAPKKHLGQNFLINHDTLTEILTTADISPNETVIEIGPGHGILTSELAKKTDNLTAIELDSDLIPELRKKFPQINLLHKDALEFEPPKTPYKLVANIPYYITSPIINHFLRAQPQNRRPQTLTLLVQHEVAQKICAQQGNLSVLALEVQIFGDPKIIAKIPPSHFRPAPKVDSAILHIGLFEKPLIADDKLEKFIALIHKGFAHKRKKLSSNLGIKNDSLGNTRAQELSITDWTNLLKRL